MVANSGGGGNGEVEISRYMKASNVLFLKLDFTHLCILFLYMWYRHGINNINNNIFMY